MAKSRYGKRNRYGNRYVARNTKGQFISNVDVGRSLKADKRRTAKRQSGSGYGQQGDAKKKSFLAHGGMEYYEGQGYDDKMDESLGMRHRGKHSQSMKDRRDEASAMDKKHSKMGRKYDDVMTMDAEFAGHTQGYNDRMDESMGMSHRGKHSQSMKDRRDESAGMEKHMGRRKYARVGTMDKSDRYMAEMEIPMNYPEGDGRVLGQVTPTTNFTPAGLHAETFGGNFKTGFAATFGVIAALMAGGVIVNVLGMAASNNSDE